MNGQLPLPSRAIKHHIGKLNHVLARLTDYSALSLRR
jgi:hypothetical protein